jgi:hypothetical protein
MTEELYVTVSTEYESDAEELAMLTQSLRQQLLETDVQDVRPLQSDAAPPGGAKAAAAIDWGALLVALGSSGGVLSGLVGALVSWVRRNQGATLNLRAGDCEVELRGTGMNLAEVQELLETCLKERGTEERGENGEPRGEIGG